MKQKENILSFTPKNFFGIDDKTSWDQEGIPPFYDIVIERLYIYLEKACLSYINYILDNDMILYFHSWIIESKEYPEKVLSIAQN